MKLNKQALKQIIKEELEVVLYEVTVRPTPPPLASDDQLPMIHGMTGEEDKAQAQSFADAFGGEPDYIEKYKRYNELKPPEKRLELIGNEFKRAVRDLQFSRNPDLQDKYLALTNAYERDAMDILNQIAKSKFPDDPQQQSRYSNYEIQSWRKKYHPPNVYN